MGAILGVDGIHHMRKEEWLTAINQGFEGVNTLTRARKKAPDFIDAKLEMACGCIGAIDCHEYSRNEGI